MIRALQKIERVWLVLFAGVVVLTFFYLSRTAVNPIPIYQPSWFQIRTIRVKAAWPLVQNKLEEKLVPYQGKNLLTISLKEISDVLMAQPWASGVNIHREFPDRLSIEVSAKRAVGVMIFQRQAYFIDSNGNRIDKVSSELLSTLDLPVLTPKSGDWNRGEVMDIFVSLQETLRKSFDVSEIEFDVYPYFKIYFSRPALTARLSAESWQSQMPILQLLLHNPPKSIHRAKHIELTVPKKAVVSELLPN